MAENEQSGKKMWMRRGKLSFYGLIALGIGFLIGLYIVAPMQGKTNVYIPKTVGDMGSAIVQFTNPDGNKVNLPVKIANDDDEREQGLNKVGVAALENIYLLYDQEDVSSWSEDYNVKNTKAPLSMAVIDGEGKVVEIKGATTSDDEVEVEKEHRWVVAMKDGLLGEYGIKVGSELATNTLP